MFDVRQVHLGSMGESIRTVIQRNGDTMVSELQLGTLCQAMRCG